MDLIDVILIVVSMIIVFVVFANYFLQKIRSIEREKDKKQIELIQLTSAMKEMELRLGNKIVQIQSQSTENAQVLATEWFSKWKQTEWESYKKKADDAGIQLGKMALQKWIIEHEEMIRKDSAKRTIAINMGKMTEHLIPFSEQFKEFNSKDARFIGSPIDLIVFDGVADKKDMINIYFIEVKTGNSAVSIMQRKIAEAIDNHRVHWKLIRREEFNWKAPDSGTP